MLVAKFTHSATSFVQVCCTFKQQLLKKHTAEFKASARVPDVWVHFCFCLCDFKTLQILCFASMESGG
jgi:hypothetical protein